MRFVASFLILLTGLLVDGSRSVLGGQEGSMSGPSCETALNGGDYRFSRLRRLQSGEAILELMMAGRLVLIPLEDWSDFFDYLDLTAPGRRWIKPLKWLRACRGGIAASAIG